ncbi:MAG: SH3 domain-containing protein [Clostridiales bacterium]|nr:SH3 domain-containing protein [Clostridiales bacterium]
MATTRKPVETATEPDQALQTVPQAVLEGAELIDYAVAGCKRLRLRAEPSPDAPIITELPCGVGVLGSASPAENGWRQVFTGRLFGWVKDEFLERLALPELDNGAE